MAQINLFKQLVVNNIALEDAPFPSELGMEAFLMDNPQILAFGDEEPGYPKIIGCEISLNREPKHQKTERQHSRLDMLVQYSESTFAVLELKNGDVDDKALKQLRAYLTPERRKEIVKKNSDKKRVGVSVRCKKRRKGHIQFLGSIGRKPRFGRF